MGAQIRLINGERLVLDVRAGMVADWILLAVFPNKDTKEWPMEFFNGENRIIYKWTLSFSRYSAS